MERKPFIATAQSPNTRTNLDPAFAPLIGEIFARAEKRSGLFRKPEREALRPLRDLLELHDPRFAATISDQMRRVVDQHIARYYYASSVAVATDRKKAVSALAIDPDAAYALSLVWSGHVRELAVRSIAKVHGPFCLALLVYRLNDWVAQVRAAAEGKLRVVGGRLSTGDIAGCIELLWEFGRVGRADSAARGLVERLATRPDALAALRTEALTSATDRAVRVVRHGLRTDALDPHLRELAATSSHPQIRSLAVRSLLRQAFHWSEGRAAHSRTLAQPVDFEALARSALQDRTTSVQFAGLEYLVSHGQTWNDYENILLRYASHPRNSLAELAQWALGRAGVDWLAQLRARFASEPDAGIAAILGKSGDASDGERLWSCAGAMSDERAMPFLAAAAKQKNTSATERLRRIVFESSKLDLARRASGVLRDAGVALSVKELAPIADQGDVFFRRGLERHLAPLNTVALLGILARLERADADFDLQGWFAKAQRKINRGAFTPTEAEEHALQQLLDQAPRLRGLARTLLAIGA